MRKLKNLNVTWISLVDKGANNKVIIYKSAENGKRLKEIEIAKVDKEKHLVYGIVYAPDEVDTQGDFVDAETIEKAAHDFLKHDRIHNIDKQHNLEEQKAYVVESWIVRKNDELFPLNEGAWAIAIKVDDEELWDSIKKEEITGLSLYGSAEAETEEAEKSLFKRFWSWLHLEKGAVAVHHIKDIDDGPWDADKAVQQLRKWASSDGSGDKDKIFWSKYQLGFAYFDSSDSENFAAYKLPHHYVRDGKLVLSRRGVYAAMGALLGARGGVEVGDAKSSVYKHLAAHYEDLDAEPPELTKEFKKSGAVISAANMKKLQEAFTLIREVINSADQTKTIKEMEDITMDLTKEDVQKIIKEQIDLFVQKQQEDDEKVKAEKRIQDLEKKVKELEDTLKKSKALPPDGQGKPNIGIL